MLTRKDKSYLHIHLQKLLLIGHKFLFIHKAMPRERVPVVGNKYHGSKASSPDQVVELVQIWRHVGAVELPNESARLDKIELAQKQQPIRQSAECNTLKECFEGGQEKHTSTLSKTPMLSTQRISDEKRNHGFIADLFRLLLRRQKLLFASAIFNQFGVARASVPDMFDTVLIPLITTYSLNSLLLSAATFIYKKDLKTQLQGAFLGALFCFLGFLCSYIRRDVHGGWELQFLEVIL